MTATVPPEVLEAFTSYTDFLPPHSAGATSVQPIDEGLIHHSYKVSCELKPHFFLQQINKNVFTDPVIVQENYVLLSQYAEFEFTGLNLPWPLSYERNKTLFKDHDGNYWRAFNFIDDSKTISIANTPAQAKATAQAFAKFTKSFNAFNIELLRETLPGFHNLSCRYEQFEKAMEGDACERQQKAADVIDELQKRERYKFFYEEITASPEFPKRVIHHDAKIGNVLFNSKTEKIICLVDLDTAMPGHFFSDVGDIIRSSACSKDENCTAFDQISIRKEFYDAITEGYLSVLNNVLTPAEKKYFHYAGLLMVYMQSLRFITDYLNCDVYYKTTSPDHNYNRAKNQLTLLKRLEEYLYQHHSLSPL
jgi:hypothetical protein